MNGAWKIAVAGALGGAVLGVAAVVCVSSAVAGDFKPVMGVTLIVGLNFMIANLLIDVLYGVLDPRLRSA